jgi:hypothetical protein
MTRPRAQTNPAHVPLVHEFIRLSDQLGYSLHTIGLRVGLSTNVLYRWNQGALPTIANFEAALNVIGYRLAIVPIEQETQP